MIILHGGLIGGYFLLWGEESLPAPTGASVPGARRKKSAPVRPLPFGLSADRLAATLGSAMFTQDGRDKLAEETVIWLPTVKGQPVASSALIAQPPAEGDAALVPWQVATLPMGAGPAIALLTACLDRTNLGPGTFVGTTLAYWSAALRYAGAMLAREQFLPVVASTTPTSWGALWEPVRAGAEGPRFNRLAQAMPAACRALSRDAATAPAVPATEVLEGFLSLVVDEMVRSAAEAGPGPTFLRRGRRRGPAFESMHDQWLHALRAPERLLRGRQEELAQLADQVTTWRRPALLAAAMPFRLCFRLEEPLPQGTAGPAEDNGAGANGFSTSGKWIARYLLQAQDDPSLLIPATEVWKPHACTATLLQRNGFQPREYLLAALGEASSICPGVERSLKHPTPSYFSTDTAGAHAFLTQHAWLLEQAGFGVLLPAWWTRQGTKQRLGVTAQVKNTPLLSGGQGLTLDTIVEFNWQVALGDHELTLSELETLARMKSPLVKVRGQWVQVRAAEIQAAIDFWKKHGDEKTTVRELMRMSLGAAAPPAGMSLRGIRATGWVGEFLAQLEGRTAFEALPPPDGLTGTLRPYQLRGYSWLAFLRRWELGGCLADDMGLGKTIQTLALLERDREAGEKRPVLLICPMSVVGNWKREAERFTPKLSVLIHHGGKRSKGDAFEKEAQKHHLVISSYSLLYRDLDHLKKVGWAGVVLDEAQNIKNPQTKQAQAARDLKAGYRLALTGTPVENHVGDLWSLWQFLHPGFLGGQTEFRRNFFIPIQVQHDAEAAERLQKLTGPFLLRRLKTDKSVIADLPEKLEMKVYCNLTKEQASLYAAVVADVEAGIQGAEGIQRKGLVLAALSKLKQVCNHPAHFLGDNSPIPDRSGKLSRLTEMLEEVQEAGERALVFTQFTEMGALIQRHLQETFGREVLFLHGGVPQKQRDRLVARFQDTEADAPDSPRVFLLSLKAGGTGLNLTAANHVFHFDRWWNPAVEDQATDRAFRIGQHKNVQVHKFVCVGTLEEKIDDMIERKQEVAARVIGAGEGWLTELSNDQLKELFALRQEAIGE